MSRPQVIFFDAVGTLFGVRGSVGQVYRGLARQYGVDIEAEQLNKAFYKSFKAAPPCAFPGVRRIDLAKLEFEWWEAIVEQTFEQVGALDRFRNFPAFYSQLYSYFETAEPWVMYDDTLPTLKKIQSLDIPMGILSNFDSRLYKVLKVLNLEEFFSSITISSEVGVAKPDPIIFTIALAKHHCEPENAWHIGDSVKEDYEAANLAGLRGVLINRECEG
jgi:putative hydrolase of the HAD superfamily